MEQNGALIAVVPMNRRPLCRAGSCVASKRRSASVTLAEPIASKTYFEIRRAVATMIVVAEHIWRANVIRRVHGDRESALLAARPTPLAYFDISKFK